VSASDELVGSWGSPAIRPAPTVRTGRAEPLRAACTIGPAEGYSSEAEDRVRALVLALLLAD